MRSKILNIKYYFLFIMIYLFLNIIYLLDVFNEFICVCLNVYFEYFFLDCYLSSLGFNNYKWYFNLYCHNAFLFIFYNINWISIHKLISSNSNSKWIKIIFFYKITIITKIDNLVICGLPYFHISYALYLIKWP